MATTSTGPSITGVQGAASATGLKGYFDSFWDFALDVGRAKLIDVEMTSDDGYLPDYTDLRTGGSTRSDMQRTSGGITAGGAAVLLAGGGMLLYFLARD